MTVVYGVGEHIIVTSTHVASSVLLCRVVGMKSAEGVGSLRL